MRELCAFLMTLFCGTSRPIDSLIDGVFVDHRVNSCFRCIHVLVVVLLDHASEILSYVFTEHVLVVRS